MKGFLYCSLLCCMAAAALVGCQKDEEMSPNAMIDLRNGAGGYPNVMHFDCRGGTDTIRGYPGPLRRLMAYQGLTYNAFYSAIDRYSREQLTMPGRGYLISDTIAGDWFRLIRLDAPPGCYYHVEVQPNLGDSARLLVLWTDNYEKVAWWYQSNRFHGWECEPYFFIDQQAP